jgi:hypothetical protein
MSRMESHVTIPIVDMDQDRFIDRLFIVDRHRPCPLGIALLQVFAEARPADVSFVELQDLCDPMNCAFAGIKEWDAFASHYSICGRCNA